MKSARAQLIKFLFIVPLIAVMLLAFRNERNKQIPYISGQSDYTDSVPDLPPPPPPPPGQPPMPPAPPADLKLPPNVKSLNMEDDKVTVVLKDGSKEAYDFTKEKEKKAFYQKYGKFLAPPPPPPPPPGRGVSIAPGTVIDESNVNGVSPRGDVTVAVGGNNAPIAVTGHANTVTGVTAPVASGSNTYGVATVNGVTVTSPVHTDITVRGVTATSVTAPVHAEGKIYNVNVTSPVTTEMTFKGLAATTVTAPVKAMVPINEVVVTGHGLNSIAGSVPVTVNVPGAASVDGLTEVVATGQRISTAKANRENYLELRISKYTSREKLDQVIAEAKEKDVEVKFDNAEYDNNGKLTRLAGKIEKEGSKTTFSLSGFEVLILSVTKINGKYDCSIRTSREKEVQ